LGCYRIVLGVMTPRMISSDIFYSDYVRIKDYMGNELLHLLLSIKISSRYRGGKILWYEKCSNKLKHSVLP